MQKKRGIEGAYLLKNSFSKTEAEILGFKANGSGHYKANGIVDAYFLLYFHNQLADFDNIYGNNGQL